MTDETELSKKELLKLNSRQLRGTIGEELLNGESSFSDESYELLKYHGTYQQDDRDLRKAKNPDGTPKGKHFQCMVRTAIPGGKLTAEQILAELDLADDVGDGTLRITTRQGFQLHGVVKHDLKETIRRINESKLTTISACGDVERNVMCCPAPYTNNPVREEMQNMADAVAKHLRPKSTAYYEIWLTDDEGEKSKVSEFKPVEEPIYGDRYLPRKFKTAFALPEDNCVDLYANDLGFLAVVEGESIVGYNVLVGGGMGTTPSADKCFPAVAKMMTFVTPDQVLDVAESIVKVQRDNGNRDDRKIARLKYVIANWGLPRFKAEVEKYYGQSLPDPKPVDVTDVDDHLGWHEQGDGTWFLGVNIDSGRIKDEGDLRLKTALRVLMNKYGMRSRLTALQGLILCDIEKSQKADIESILREHGIELPHELTRLRRFAISCPALPTCGLAVTESERIMPSIVAEFEETLRDLDMIEERITVHMTGCPNGCARPYTPDIGLVGKAKDKYTLFLGGHAQGTRLAYIYKDMVPRSELIPVLRPVLEYFKSDRQNGESFGDFCHRKGQEAIVQHVGA